MESKSIDNKERVVQTCFKINLNNKELMKEKQNTMLRLIELVCFVGPNIEQKKLKILVTDGINFDLFTLLSLSSIHETKTINVKEIFYMNTKCKVNQNLPNEPQKWLKMNCCKKR